MSDYETHIPAETSEADLGGWLSEGLSEENCRVGPRLLAGHHCNGVLNRRTAPNRFALFFPCEIC